MEDDLLDEEELKLLQSILNPEVEKSALEKMQLGAGNDCSKCGKVVGHAEEVRKANKVFHKHCYTCNNCDSRLAKGDELEHEGDWFCKYLRCGCREDYLSYRMIICVSNRFKLL